MHFKSVISATAALALVVVTAGPSTADLGPDIVDVASIVTAASPDAAGVESPSEQSHTGAVFESSDVTLDVPTSSDEPLVLVDESGHSLEVSLPSEIAVEDGAISDDGTVVFLGDDSDTHAAVQMLEDGRVRIQTVLESPDSPHTYSYDMDSSVTPVLRADGGVDLVVSTVDDVTTIAGEIAAPWAVDANGRAVPTWYSITGSTVIQHVAHDPTSAYPITADPTYSYGWWRYVHFNKAETKTIADSGWSVAAITAACAIANPAAGVVCAAAFGSIVYTAGVAKNTVPMKCLVLKFPYTGAYVVPGTYRDSRCK